MRSFLLLAGATALVVSAPVMASAAPNTARGITPLKDPGAALVQAANAARTTNFRGVLLYRSGSMMEVLRVTHRYQAGEESERIVTLSGQPQEMIRHGRHLTYILPRDRRFTFESPSIKGIFNALSDKQLKELSQWYQFHYLGDARVAGRVCSGIAVVPRDQYRFGYHVWADNTTDVPLRVNLLNDKGEQLEEVMFTEVSFPKSIPDSAFNVTIKGSNYRVVTRKLPAEPTSSAQAAQAKAAMQQPISWEFDRLPPGYKVTLRDTRELPNKLGRVQHILLSDGLSAVSVFIAPPRSDRRAGFTGLSRMGAVDVYGRMVNGYQVTVIGEVPEATVSFIGDAIEQVKGLSSASPASVAPAKTGTGN